MKLSVKRKFGYTRVRGGRVLVVNHDHQISTVSYDNRAAAVTGDRVFEYPWETAKVGDIAIEIVAAKTDKILGYGYLSGAAINLNRYVTDADRDIVGAWFSPGRALRLDLVPNPRALVDTLVTARISGAQIAISSVNCADDEIVNANNALSAAADIAEILINNAPNKATQTTDIIIRLGSGNAVGVIHWQTSDRGQKWACHPFLVEVLMSSTHLETFSPQSEDLSCSTTSSTTL